jgi:hypothetical protein
MLAVEEGTASRPRARVASTEDSSVVPSLCIPHGTTYLEITHTQNGHLNHRGSSVAQAPDPGS